MEQYLGVLNRLIAFGGDEGTGKASSMLLSSLAELDAISHRLEKAPSPPLLCEDGISICADLLEAVHPASPVVSSIYLFLAVMALREENRELLLRFGVAGTSVVLLQSHAALSSDGIFYLLDVISTLASCSGVARTQLRPGIPYILAAMKSRPGSLDVLFGGSFALSTLTMLDADNCELVASRGGLQILVDTYGQALSFAKTLKQELQRHQRSCGKPSTELSSIISSASDAEPRRELCLSIQRWSKDTLLKVCRTPSAAIDGAIDGVSYGTYGASLEMDELKWALKFERKKSAVKAS